MFKRSTVLGLAAASMLALACGKGDTEKTGEVSAADTPKIDEAQARQIFESRCAACHGPEGRGNGPGAVALNPKPRNYHDKAWQSQVTDDQLRKVIVYGGAAVGKSPMMPANPDLDSKPEVVEGLVRIVRRFGKS